MASTSSIGSAIVTLLPERIEFDAGDLERRDVDPPQSLAGQAMDFVRTTAMEQIRSSLELGETGLEILDAVSDVWARAIVLREYADPEIHPPDRTETVHLTEHSITLTGDLIVQVRIAGVIEAPVNLLLEVKLSLKAVALSIRSGEIVAAGLGEATGVAALSFEGLQLHPDLPEQAVQLGPQIDFAKGVPIM